MSRTSGSTVSSAVLALLQEISGDPAVAEDLQIPIFELQIIDSLQTVELIVAVSERFGIEISPTEIDRDTWATPERIIQFVEQRLAQ